VSPENAIGRSGQSDRNALCGRPQPTRAGSSGDAPRTSESSSPGTLAPDLLPGFDKLDALFVGFISFSLIPDELRLR
jgi:hypothetical protein